MARQIRKVVCDKGHDDWHISPGGTRYCVICRREYDKERRTGRPKPGSWAETKRGQGDRGPREETFTREELLRLRGYDI